MRIFQEEIKGKQTEESFQKMGEQVAKAGGSLHFSMKIDNEGWFAVCKEFPGIVTGGPNKNPAEEELFHSIIESVKTAFDIPIINSLHDGEPTQKSGVRVTLEREREFSFA
jgi:hypothetical protein